MKFDKHGRELPDPTPVALPVGANRPPSLQEQIRRMVRNEVSMVAEANEMESFREANDFEVDEDDPEAFLTPYEVQGMHEEIPDERREESVARGSDGGDRASGDAAVDVGKGGEGVQRADVAGGGEDRSRQSGSPQGTVQSPAKGSGPAAGQPVGGSVAQ